MGQVQFRPEIEATSTAYTAADRTSRESSIIFPKRGMWTSNAYTAAGCTSRGITGGFWDRLGSSRGAFRGIFVDVDAEDMNVKEGKGNAWTRKERKGK